MSIFSQLLQEHFQEKKVKIYQIAQLSNIERTLLQKILTGSRKPSSEEQVTRLAQALMLTASETKELKNAYQILHMGEENWSRRSAVRKLVQSFHINDSPFEMGFTPDVSFTFQEETNVIYGAINVKRALYSVLLQESCNPQGEISIVSQPDFSFLINSLNIINFTHLPITHFISFGSRSEDSTSNLNLLERIIPTLLTCKGYIPFGYYENTPSLFGPNAFLPNILLTARYSIQISSDYDCAVISTNRDFMKLLSNFIKQKRVSAFPIFEKQTAFEVYLDSLFVQPLHEQRFIMMDKPYLIPFLTSQMCENYLHRHELGEERMEAIKKHILRLQQTETLHSIFSVDGLQQFFSTGRFTEMPKLYYSTLHQQDAHFLLNEALTMQEQGHYRMHIIKQPHLSFPPNLTIRAFSSLQVSFIINHPKVGFLALNLQDPSFSFAIYDFLQYMMEENLSHSPEESASMVRSFLNRQ